MTKRRRTRSVISFLYRQYWQETPVGRISAKTEASFVLDTFFVEKANTLWRYHKFGGVKWVKPCHTELCQARYSVSYHCFARIVVPQHQERRITFFPNTICFQHGRAPGMYIYTELEWTWVGEIHWSILLVRFFFLLFRRYIALSSRLSFHKCMRTFYPCGNASDTPSLKSRRRLYYLVKVSMR